LADPLSQPAILMLGSEDKGLMPDIIRNADYAVTISRAKSRRASSVDSLNVSTAAAILCDAFLQQRSSDAQGGEERSPTDSGTSSETSLMF
jgi:21S rRNA (GM2251-2'-O)-methyltransferase